MRKKPRLINRIAQKIIGSRNSSESAVFIAILTLFALGNILTFKSYQFAAEAPKNVLQPKWWSDLFLGIGGSCFCAVLVYLLFEFFPNRYRRREEVHKNDQRKKCAEYINELKIAESTNYQVAVSKEFAINLLSKQNKTYKYFRERLEAIAPGIVEKSAGEEINQITIFETAVVDCVQRLIKNEPIHELQCFIDAKLRIQTETLLKASPKGEQLQQLKCMLLEDAFYELVRNQKERQLIISSMANEHLFDGDVDLDMENIDLSYLNLVGLNLTRINLRGARLVNTRFDDAIVFRANFVEADLRTAHFNRAICISATFVESNCTKAHFRDANLENAYFMEAKLLEADFEGAEIKGARFKRLNGKDAAIFDSETVNPFGIKMRPGVSFDDAL